MLIWKLRQGLESCPINKQPIINKYYFMKTLLKILLFLFIPMSFFMVSNSTYALDENLNTGNKKAENSAVDKNKHLDNIQGETDFTISR